MSSDTRDGISYESTVNQDLLLRGLAIRNADCEDIERVIQKSINFSAFMLTFKSNDKRSFFIWIQW